MLLLLAVLTLLVVGPVPIAAGKIEPPGAADGPALAADSATPIQADFRSTEALKAAGDGLFIVRLDDAPVATYGGGKPGLARTRPDLGRGRGQRLRAASPAVQAYRAHLEDARGQVLTRAQQALDRRVRPQFVYDYVVNGFAAHFTPEEAARVAALPGVADVRPDEVYELHTDNGPQWIGADTVWGDGSEPALETRGEGVLVGMIDTGINPSNPSFAEVGPVDGYVHTNPFGTGNFRGACDPGNPQYQANVTCNDKLVGAWNFVADADPAGALDVDGHGSHTASTAAGNLVEAEVFSPTEAYLERTISGVAPHANVISYRGCQRGAGCPLSALTASINQAIADGVDVINYSIGGGSRDPWADENALAFLDARAAGVFVATSAGNSGPGAGTVGSPADAPWVTSVGASTHDRNLPNTLTLGGAAGAPGPYVGKSFTSGFGPATIVSAGDYPNPNDPGGNPLQCMEPYPAGTFDGEVVVCERGTIARVAKGANVLAGGAGGLVLMNDAPSGDSLNSDPHFLPAVHVGHSFGLDVLGWLSSVSGHTAEISGAVLDVDDGWGDVMAAFSSRGPNAQMDIISPNVAAPGVDIIAAYGSDDDVEWTLVSGTSMASPHVAGAGALLSGLHPGWTPAEIQSALMTTAITAGVLKEDSATAADWFDMGSGRIDVARASRAGLVLDETLANYEDADPSEGGDPKTLNLPSMANSQCLGSCTWTRTVTATALGAGTWETDTDAQTGLDIEVSPQSFTLADGQSQVLEITADVGGADEGAWLSGRVILTHGDAGTPTAHLPVAVVPTAGVIPDLVEIDTRRDAGSQLVTGLQALASPELSADAHGLAQATIHDEEVSQDPANGSPYDDIDDNWWTTFAVGADSLRLVAEIFATTAPDLDLFVGTGGTPSLATEVCRGTTAASFEYCDIDDPQAGTWWVMVQAWAATSPVTPDPFSLAVAAVPEASTGTMTIDVPESIGEGESFDARVFWDADMDSGDRWYGAFTLSSSPSNPGDIGTVPVNLRRHPDDVTKTVDSATAEHGDTLTYTITVEPNVTPVDLTYTIEDTIPDDLTYVEGSVTGDAVVDDGVVSWSGTMASPAGVEGDYSVATNLTDPSCDTPLGGWVDLQSFGIGPVVGIDGDGAWTAFASGAPIQFYGREFVGATLLSTGFTIFDFAANFGSPYWVPQSLPDAAAPNNLVASLWQDTEIVYDAVANSGVRLVTLGGTGADGWIIIDYDRVELFGGSADNWSHQLWVRRTPDPAGHDIVVAYNDLGSLSLPFTVGVENPGGLKGTAHVNAQPATGLIDDSTVVCFDYAGPSFDAHVITYQVTVDNDVHSGTLTNAAVHDTDNPGSQPVTASAGVLIDGIPEVVSVTVSPDLHRLRIGHTAQFTAIATLVDGSEIDVTTSADWESSNTAIVEVDDTGGILAMGGGFADVTATYEGHSDDAVVHVTGPPHWLPTPPGLR
jgi:uncharacterized repeat protein (TIGR01451 family)